ncbi:putative UDP-N-acetylglucosamine pyrophosphorylase [Plesiocystis pacifica SIR-1]|uniref:Putative UDP-N-acetylglucosamine pyrophosphorylase n=1 Tax=Plesiocystis pacifica SIR-1 TaxID=391625 RepID=A6FZ04_9BACT|nr:hypothetical protein [Plesiocystis pacifica]EDM81159.1 putative UDP-N-acetylglucosamine pyrophosphorylase [Plesiocystis pacifica SIR-1]
MSAPQAASSLDALEGRLTKLREGGVTVVDPRQTYLGPEVELGRIHPGVVLHPGTRLTGARTYLGPKAEIGREGPAVLVDAVIGPGAKVASGYVEGAVLLDGAKLGANVHARPGTLLEEEASTAHAVGLKQTILLSFVTLGSVINFCDCLMAGGTSRKDHSEVGSGFIHFNFTPWGERGDKATPSLIGDVPRGVFLREPRIFLGGLAGIVGPTKIGFGAIAAAGQIVRRSLDDRAFVLRAIKPFERTVRPNFRDRLQPRLGMNVDYITQLVALREWYRGARLPRLSAEDPRRVPVEAGLELLDGAIAERQKQLGRFVDERGGQRPGFELDPARLPPCPFSLGADDGEGHVEWVQALSEAEVEAGQAWLRAVVEAAARAAAS